MKRGIFLAIVFVICLNFSQAYNFGEEQDVNVNIFQGNLTNFSQMADSDTGTNLPNEGEGLTWSSSISKWVSTILDGDSIWKKVGNVISPLNKSNLDMSVGGGNVTASFYFGDGSQLINIPSSGNLSWNQTLADARYWNIDGDNATGGYNIDGNITIQDTIFLESSDHTLKIGNDIFNGLASESVVIDHDEEHPLGTIAFMITNRNKTIMFNQVGRNNSAGLWGNSSIVGDNRVANDNFSGNMTKASDCLDWYNLFLRLLYILEMLKN